jgi:F0F1-type ATP synthase assembly protein I
MQLAFEGSMGEEPKIDESPMFASYGIIGAILLFGAAGYALDRWLDSAPWLLLLGLASGVAVGFFGVIRSVRQR